MTESENSLNLAVGRLIPYTWLMNRTAVEEIKARIPIEELIGSYVKLEKAGKAFKARCPFHNEKTASFFVSPDRGGYYCFRLQCQGRHILIRGAVRRPGFPRSSEDIWRSAPG
jgi:DNA primase